jgi:hypothetical protein
MQTAAYVAIVAAIISFISLIVAIISCVIAAKNYKKSKRLELLQRRDQLFLKISDLNAKNSELRLISARFEIVMLNKVSLNAELVMDKEFAEENKTQIARIKGIRENIELVANHWDGTIQQLHSLCSSFTLETDATSIEKLITRVQIASDEAKMNNEGHLASLHTLETTAPMLRASVGKVHELEIRRAELDLEEAIREIKRNEKVPDQGL